MKSFFFSALSLFLLLAACNKDDTPQPAEQELITTLRMKLTDTAGLANTFTYKVENGFGSTTPGTVQIDTVTLVSGRTYRAELAVLNEKESPAEDITPQIISESDDHLFFLTVAPNSGAGGLLTITDMSTDNQNKLFAQKFGITAGVGGNGTLTITLLHEPTNKSAGTVAGAGGETDLEATFPVRITP